MNVAYPMLGLTGRLGNSLYELAATAGIAHAAGVEPRFNADWIHRPYFRVPDEYFTDDFTGCVLAHEAPAARHIDERARVYLQDFDLFADILPTVREWLAPSLLAEQIMSAEPQVAAFEQLPRPVLSVHVRRGDNAPGGDPGTPDKHLYHPMPPLSYYQRAIDVLRGESKSIAVFSDDIDWCTQYLRGADFYYSGVTRPKEHEADFLTAPVLDWVDWQLLTRADFAVVSNSTFGMMAAIIGEATTVCPTPVYGPKLSYIDESLLMPPTWIHLVTEGDRASRP